MALLSAHRLDFKSSQCLQHIACTDEFLKVPVLCKGSSEMVPSRIEPSRCQVDAPEATFGCRQKKRIAGGPCQRAGFAEALTGLVQETRLKRKLSETSKRRRFTI